MRFVMILSLAGVAAAQTTSISGSLAAPIPARAVLMSGAAGAVSFASVGPYGGGMSGVTGMPYSAEQVTENVQTLADGTHITQPEETTRFYRDSQGRTRTEHTFRLPVGLQGVSTAPAMIEIMDPIAGVHYMLDSQSKRAHKMTFPTALPPPPPPAGSEGRLGTPVRRLAANVSADESLRPQFSHESLGTQTMEGVVAEGTRATTTYPVGSIGNDRPITVTTETWRSPELKITVLSKTSDPRSGERTTKLINVSRAEPDPSLFQVPADYELIEQQPPTPRQ